MTIKRLLGSAPSQVSRNRDLGTMAFQNKESVQIGNIGAAADVVTLGNGQVTKDASGNLGIGTSSPVNGANYKTLTINGTNGGQIAFQASGTTIAYLYNTPTVPFIFYGSGSELARIDSSGNVGIGTSSPSYKLQIGTTQGNIGIGNASGNGGASVAFLGSNTNKNWLIGNQYNLGGLEITPSTTAGGASFTTPAVVIDDSSNFKFNSGYGSAATAYGCRAWVSFIGNGGIGYQTIYASGNITSVNKTQTGWYTVSFTNALVDTNYAISWAAQPTVTNIGSDTFPISPLTTSVEVRHYEQGTPRDCNWGSVAIFR